MPIETISAEHALRRLYDRSRDQLWPDGRSSNDRFDDVATIKARAAFSFNRTDRIFTAGSCFARNIERRLREADFTTPMYDAELEQRMSELGLTAFSLMNKYNMGAIRHEIEWAFGEGACPPDATIVPLADDAVHDLLLSPGRDRVTREVALAARREIQTRYRGLPDCRVVVLTMGLAEVWRDLDTGLALNHMPPAEVLKAHPTRFVLDVLSHADILDELNAIHALLVRFGHPDAQIVLTVSPVPLHATFRDKDVLVANTYSKSVQRAAAEAFSVVHDNVAYFPSYETVTLTDRRIAFDSDNRHVQSSVVDLIVDRFLALYVADGYPSLPATEITPSLVTDPDDPKHVLRTAQYLAQIGRLAEAAEHYQRLITDFPDRMTLPDRELIQPTVIFQSKVVRLFIEAGALDRALAATDELVRLAEGDPAMIRHCLDLYLKLGKPERVLSLVGNQGAAAEGLSEDDIQLRLGRAFLLGQRYEDAARVLNAVRDRGTLPETAHPQLNKAFATLDRAFHRS